MLAPGRGGPPAGLPPGFRPVGGARVAAPWFEGRTAVRLALPPVGGGPHLL